MNLQVLNGTTTVYNADIEENQTITLPVASKGLDNDIVIQTTEGAAGKVIVTYNGAVIFSATLGNSKLVLNTASKGCDHDILLSVELIWIDPVVSGNTLTIQQAYSIEQSDENLNIQ